MSARPGKSGYPRYPRYEPVAGGGRPSPRGGAPLQKWRFSKIHNFGYPEKGAKGHPSPRKFPLSGGAPLQVVPFSRRPFPEGAPFHGGAHFHGGAPLQRGVNLQVVVPS